METAASLCDAFEAMRLLEARYFDAAFLDIRMPGLSGLDIIRRRVGQPFCPAFVVISGYSDFIYMKQAIQLGAFDYCLKPLQKAESAALLDRLEPHLYQNRLKNGPLLLARLCDPKTQDETLAFCGLSKAENPLTVIAAAVPSCKSLLSLAGGKLFSILRTSSGRCFHHGPGPRGGGGNWPPAFHSRLPDRGRAFRLRLRPPRPPARAAPDRPAAHERRAARDPHRGQRLERRLSAPARGSAQVVHRGAFASGPSRRNTA